MINGKWDKTLNNEKNEATKKYQRDTVVEEHITMIKGPGAEYISHVTPVSGRANDVCDSLLKKLNDIKAPLSSMRAISGDGTNVNTGCSSGTIIRIFLIYLVANVRHSSTELAQRNLEYLKSGIFSQLIRDLAEYRIFL